MTNFTRFVFCFCFCFVLFCFVLFLFLFLFLFFFSETQSQLGARRRPVGYFKNTSDNLNLELLIENPREDLKQNQLAVRERFELRAF